MPIIVNLDVLMAARKTSLSELASNVGISTTNLSLLKNGHVRGVRFNTLAAICKYLRCQPGDILEFRE
jgi:putative transcriptional regulator